MGEFKETVTSRWITLGDIADKVAELAYKNLKTKDMNKKEKIKELECRIEAIREDIKELKDDKSVDITQHSIDAYICPSTCSSEFNGKAFFLSSLYDWEIMRDKHGYSFVVPTKKC